MRVFSSLSNRLRHEKLAACRVLLDSDSDPECPTASLFVEPVVNDVEPVSTIVCHQCGKGHMLVVDYLPSTPSGSESLEQLGGSPVFDTS